MKNFLKIITISVFTVTILSAIQNNSSGFSLPCTSIKNYSDSLPAILKVIENIQDLISGEIIKIEKKYKKEMILWKSEVTAINGGIINFEFNESGDEIIGIESGTGPFDYDMLPGKDGISFSAARFKTEEHTGQKVLKWSFRKSKEIWEYNFWVYSKSGKAQIRINSLNGEIIQKKKRK